MTEKLRAFSQTLWRALPWLLLVGFAMAYVGDRYRIAINDQVAKCIPPYQVFLIDRHDHRIERGKLYAFSAGTRLAPFFPPEMLVVKRVVGVPGDLVEVGTERTLVNAAKVGEGLDLAGTLQRDPRAFVRTVQLRDGDVWIMGDTRDSFDARYWGTLPSGSIIGRAYGVF